MPATGSPSPGGDNPERLEIMRYDGEIWDTTGRPPGGAAPQVRFNSILIRFEFEVIRHI